MTILSLSSRSILRSYATHATPSAITTTQSKHLHKILSTSEDSSKLTASISLVIKAGTRYEPTPGIAHLLKNSVFKSTQKRSALGLVRETELLGGVLTSSLSREHLILTAEFLKGNERYFAQVLGDVLTSSEFSIHEYNEEALPGAISEYHQSRLDTTVVAVDQAHQVAFRKGLGNSIFLNPHSHVSHDLVIEYARNKFGQVKEQSIVGTGIHSEKLTELVNQFFSTPSSIDSSTKVGQQEFSKSTYYGGDARITSHPSSEDTFLICFKGSDGPSHQHPEYTVLQHLLGSHPASIKWSNGTKPLSSLPVKAFHLSYSDIGLFGLLVKASASHVSSIASKALNELKNIANGNNVDQQSVTGAARKAQFLTASNFESNVLGNELLGTRSILSPDVPGQQEELYSSYSKVTPDQVIKAAKSIINSQPTTVAVGNIHELPYFDQLGF